MNINKYREANINKYLLISIVFIAVLLLPRISLAANEPVLFFSDLESGPKTGWEGSTTKGAAVTVWGKNFGSTRGGNYVTVNGAQITEYAEWGAIGPARGLERITFWLNSNCQDGLGSITVTVNGKTSNALPFTVRSGNIYFVAPSGNNDWNGKYSTSQGGSNGPWLDQVKAKNSISPGDIVYFRGGTYTVLDEYSILKLTQAAHMGTAGNPKAFVGYPAETAIWNATGLRPTIWNAYSSTQVVYWVFSKLKSSGETFIEIDQGAGIGNVRIIGNDITTLQTSTNTGCLILQGNTDHLSIYGNYIHDCGLNNRGDSPTRNAYGVYVGGYGTQEYIYFGWNEISYNPYGRGIQIYGHQSSDTIDHLYIHDNYIHHNSAQGLVLGGGDPSVPYTFIKNVWIYNNIIALNGYGDPKFGYYPGVKMGNNSGADGGNFYFYNNTFYKNSLGSGGGSQGEISYSGSLNSAIFKNNIFYAGSGCLEYYNFYGGTDPSKFTANHNCYYGIGNGPTWDTNPVNADPLFIDSENENFRLQSNSPTIDVGTSDVNSILTRDFDGNSRPQGLSYDAGAYEYLASSFEYVVCQCKLDGSCDCLNYSTPTMSKPAKGQSFSDPDFHTKITRITDKTIDGYPGSGLVNSYARMDIENSDGSYIIVHGIGSDWNWYLYDAINFKLIKKLLLSIDSSEPEERWDAQDSNIFYYRTGTSFYKYDIRTDISTLLHDFKDEHPTAYRVRNQYEGKSSKDSRYWAFKVENSSGAAIALVVYDKDFYGKDNGKIVGTLNNPNNNIDWISMSLTGERVVVGYLPSSGHPTTAYNRDFTNPTELYSSAYLGSEAHCDLALDANGNDVWVWQRSSGYPGQDWVHMVDLYGNNDILLYPIQFYPGAEGSHFSGNNIERPGWILVSTYGQGLETKGWQDKALFMVELKENPRIWRIVHTHQPYYNYWTEAFATINKKGTKVYWASNWDVEGTSAGLEIYQVELPSTWWSDLSGVQTDTTPPAPPTGVVVN